MAAEPLTPEESGALAAAILELAEAGDHEAAARLGDLAKDPAELRKVLAEGDRGAPAAAE
jgi:hypothetical protein